MDMPTAIDRVIQGVALSREEMQSVMHLIMQGQATPAQIGGFLIGLRIKGETVDEIAGAALTMRALATPVAVDTQGLVDTCGTGGSGISKFNISTASAFVAAAAGARVAKHGNRSATSKSGSADVLEAAGAQIMLTPDEVARCIETVGVGFLFAQSHHGAMKHAIGPRREMAVRTIFNMLGPLTNPAGAVRQVLGVYDGRMLRSVAEVLKALGSIHVMVIHSDDGLDEISVAGQTRVAELKDGEISEYSIAPEDFSLTRQSLAPLMIEDSVQSFALVKSAISGKNALAADIVALNAGAAIYTAGIAKDLRDGVDMAMDAIGNGLATEKLSEFVALTNQLKAIRE